MHPLYRILEELAVKRGDSAILWHAHDEVLDREVAVKELRNWAARPARARAAFQFAHLRRLSLVHPGLAPVYGEDSDRGWVMLDYYPAGSLGDRLAHDGGPLPLDTVVAILLDGLDTLAFLHEQGLIHGAVKPANLFFTAKGQVLLADGLGLRMGAGRARDNRDVLARVEPEDAKYLAPECLDGRADRVDTSSDLYALGLTVLELLLGGAWYATLFPRVQLAAQRWDEWQRSSEALPSLLDLLPEAPGTLVRVLDGLLRKPREERLTASGALALLRPPVPPPPPAPIAQAVIRPSSPARAIEVPQVKRKRRWTPVAWLLAGAVGSAVAFVAWPKPEQPSDHTAQLAVELQSLEANLVAARAETHDWTMRALNLDKDLQAARARHHQAGIPVEALAVRSEQLEKELAELRSGLSQARSELRKAAAEGEETRNRAATLESELKVAREREATLESEVKGARAGQTLAGVDAKNDRLRAEQLAREVTEVQARLAGAQKDLEDSGKRVEQMEKDLRTAREQVKQNDVASKALEEHLHRLTLAALKKLDARFEVDPASPAHAVIKVDLAGDQVSDEDLALLAGVPELQGLSLSCRNVSDAGLVHLKDLVNLRSLSLFRTPVTDAALVHLQGMGNLQTLSLASTRVTDAGLAMLKPLGKLQSLDLSFTRVSDAGLPSIKELHNLEMLFLAHTQVDDEATAALKELARLHTLDLSFTKVGDVGMVSLAGQAYLEVLLLSHSRVGDRGLSHLRGLARLHTLDLSFTKVTDEGLTYLKELSSLETLSLSSTGGGDNGLPLLKRLARLHTLDLSSTKVSDEGLVHLKELAHLKTLSLNATSVSDKGLVHLKGLVNLADLYLGKTTVSDSGAATLRIALPQCTLHR